MSSPETAPPLNIDVAVPHIEAITLETCIPEITALFRRSAHLSAAVHHVAKRNSGEKSLAITSDACSTAAEMDSTIALLRKVGFDEIAATGRDKNPVAIARARRGLHWIPEAISIEERDSLKTFLESYGFGFEVDAVADAEGQHNYQGQVKRNTRYHKIDSNPVREGNRVIFQQYDLLSGEDIKKNQHLVLLNNLVYYYPADKADQVMRFSAAQLADNGVLSIDESVSPNRSGLYMGIYFGHREATFYDWIMCVTDLLEVEFQLKPIESDPQGLPMMFGRE